VNENIFYLLPFTLRHAALWEHYARAEETYDNRASHIRGDNYIGEARDVKFFREGFNICPVGAPNGASSSLHAAHAPQT
jgi:hypothetical protein